MEVQNPAAESQSSDRSQPVPEMDGDGGSKLVGAPADVVDGGGAGRVETELGNGGTEVVKKKRGRPPRAKAKSPPPKIIKEEEEDVCFICFDGGSLVLCDRRGCPKAYHPACIKRDEAFFQSKAKWNCGWHICSICQKAAHHMCYTCTYSLCKRCVKKADYVCVRGDKGFCTICMKTIMLIENSGQGKDATAQVDFDDKTSWEYLFKVYWVYLKGKLSLTLDELTQAKNPWKGESTLDSVSPSTCVHNNGGNERKSITSAISVGNTEANESKRRKTDEQINMPHKEIVPTEKLGTDETSSTVPCKDWATKELLDFVAHMRNGDTSALSQFDVQALMLEYIKRNNLRDPRKKSQIICDSRLKNLFGKPRVGHFEMLKLLEFHFFIKENSLKNTINSSMARQGDADWKSDNLPVVGREKKRRNHRKGEERTPQNKVDEYAAIDVHNMSLVYLRRKLMEDLLEDSEKFHAKVVGSIVRIRISGSDQKHDMYRLVQVVGTSKVDVPYKVGNRSANVVLEVLNLDKKETVSIDTISNQDMSEDECRRLRQSIRCGLVKRFTVGEIEERAITLQSVRLNDWMETEILRLNNLRDRASEKGHKKGLREYVGKLQLLKSPEERERRLREIPEVHSDPKMNPDYETDDTEEYFNKEHGEDTKPKYSGVSGKNASSPRKRAESSNEAGSRSWKNEQPRHLGIPTNTNVEEGSTKATGRTNTGKVCNGSTVGQTTGNSSVPKIASETPASNDGEVDKVWHYRDPSGKVQGPFSMVQLQKWSTTGYFPDDMRIWMRREDESLLLNYVLKEQFHTHDVRWSQSAADPSSSTVPDTNPSAGQNSSAKNTLDPNPPNGASLVKFNVSKEPDMASPTPEGPNADVKNDGGSSVFSVADAAVVDLPSPTPRKTSNEEEIVQDTGVDEPSMTPPKLSGNPPDCRVVGGAQLPKTAEEWHGSSPTAVKHEEWDLGRVSVSPMKPLEVVTTNIEQIIHSSPVPLSQPEGNYHQPSWHGVRETIEFSTLAEESVSDLLAEVDAMESQNGFPSPTSRRNSFVEDLFNGSFDEFSPTTRSDGFSSSGDMHLPCQSTTTTAATPTTTTIDEHLVRVSHGNNSNVFIPTERDGNAKSGYDFRIPHGTNSENMTFKWPEVGSDIHQHQPQYLIDINNSLNVEADEGERETKTNDVCEPMAVEPNARRLDPVDTEVPKSTVSADHRRLGDGTTQPTRVAAAAAKPRAKPGGGVPSEEEDGEFIEAAAVAAPSPVPPLPPPPPPPLPSLTMGLSPVDPQVGSNHSSRQAQETTNTGRDGASRSANVGWDPHQRRYGGERYNSNSPRERSHHVEDPGYSRGGRSSWSRQSSFSSGGGGGGGYSRPPPKGQRVCKFYESGRCKKGASCKYWHP